jgi:predicted amidohydrolase
LKKRPIYEVKSARHVVDGSWYVERDDYTLAEALNILNWKPNLVKAGEFGRLICRDGWVDVYVRKLDLEGYPALEPPAGWEWPVTYDLKPPRKAA